VVDVHEWHALFANTYLWHELVHMYIAGYIVSGFLLASAYAWARTLGPLRARSPRDPAHGGRARRAGAGARR
jgi:cytochrome bd-type quinol oxidase subunit 1